jgi:ArsR family transcriptional regulator, arsenate/arsenite/antimonite-responsive transcriptional repressor
MDLIEVFKALGDETRVRILGILLKTELCVCEIEIILGLTQSNASRHLNKLKSTGIITSEKKSQWVYYRINEKFIEESVDLYKYLRDKVNSVMKVEKDVERLKKYQDSSFTCEELSDEKDKIIKCLEG